MFQIRRMFFESVNIHKVIIKCHTALSSRLVEQLQHLSSLNFHTVVKWGFSEMARNVIFIL